MSNEYVIFEDFLGGASCQLDVEDYKKAKSALEIVSTAFRIEESFSLAAHSYIDLEKMLMSASLEWGLEDEDYASYSDYFDHWREVINLKLLSLLTAGVAYTENMERIAKRACIQGFDWKTYKPRRNQIYDSELCYRAMYALRNFSIHEELPISGISVSIKNETHSGICGESEQRRQRLTCSPHIKTEPLIASEKFKNEVKSEIEELNVTGIDLKFFTRGYVESVFELHSIVRELTEAPLVKALEDLSKMETLLSEVKGEDCKLAHISEKGAGLNSALYIDTSRHFRVLGKRQKWKKLKKLRGKYISSETTLRKEISLGDAGNTWIQS